MQFPSLQSLGNAAWRGFRRFPVAILLAAKAVFLGMRLTHRGIRFPDNDASFSWSVDAIVSCYLGMLLSIAATIWVERRSATASRRGTRYMYLSTQVIVLVLTAAYFRSLPADWSPIPVIRTVVLAFGLHWLIAVIAFRRGEVNGFWQFNKRLFIRILTAFLFSAVLVIGVNLALVAVDQLFKLNIKAEYFGYSWWIFGGLFSVWIFLSGFPKDYESPGSITDYPKGLRVFTQYILLTLVTVYLAILYAYLLKIVFTWRLPVGWVSWLVMGLAVGGIFSLLLIYPLRNDPESAWVRGYWKFFFVAQLPLIALLFVAVFRRILPYGITEERYYLLLLAVWLLAMTVYFLLSERKDIRLVPLSLCLIAFLSVAGPWSAFSVSLRSQRHRLVHLLEGSGLMEAGKVGKPKPGAGLPARARQAISSVTEYIVSAHGYRSLQPLFRQDLDSLMRVRRATGRWSSFGQTNAVLSLMDVQYTYRGEGDEVAVRPVVTMRFQCEPEHDARAILTSGSTYLGNFSVDPSDSNWDFVLAGGMNLKITLDTAGSRLELGWVGISGTAIVDLGQVRKDILQKYQGYAVTLPAAQLELQPEGGDIAGSIVLTHLEGEKRDGNFRFTQVRGLILFSRK